MGIVSAFPLKNGQNYDILKKSKKVRMLHIGLSEDKGGI